ncbi:MAG: hypothetical protein JKX88_09250 [Marinicaulis sp.]|nr:hypothetical protein [Marinicaulis sp.]
MKRDLFVAALAILTVGCSQENQETDTLELKETGAVQIQGDNDNIANENVVPDAQPQSTHKGALPPGSVRVQPVQIMDRGGFGKPMVAVTKMMPVGWRAQGGVIWRQNMSGCGPNTPHFDWTATSPDGVSMISVLPGETWSGNNLQMQGMMQTNCPNVTTTDAKQFIASYVQRLRPNARVLDYMDRSQDKEAKELQQQLQQQNVPVYGVEMRVWVGAGQALIGYQVNGQEVREVIGTGIIFNLMRMEGVMPGEIREFLTLSVLPGFAMRMPEGKLDFQQVEMFRKSSKVNPEWSARMAQHQAKMARINSKGAADRAAITRKTNQEISDMQMDSWRKQQASSDRNVREFSESIREVETYSDPNVVGGSVELNSNYDNAWRLDDGTYVLTDDASFNPYASTGQNGQLLEPTR